MKECECGGVGPCQCEPICACGKENCDGTCQSCNCSNCTCQKTEKISFWQKMKKNLKNFFQK